MVHTHILVASFAIIGGGLKYIDEAFDEGIFDKRIAAFLATILIIIWIGLSVLDPISGSILLAIILGVLFTGKIDNTVFETSTAAIFGALIFLGKFLIGPVLFLAIAGVIDEKGNDYVDSHRSNSIIEFFFLHRFTMKIGLFILCLTGVFAYYYLIAFLLFDVAYDAMGLIGNYRKNEHHQKIMLEKNLPNPA
jgi:hypothetical protein